MGDTMKANKSQYNELPLTPCPYYTSLQKKGVSACCHCQCSPHHRRPSAGLDFACSEDSASLPSSTLLPNCLHLPNWKRAKCYVVENPWRANFWGSDPPANLVALQSPAASLLVFHCRKGVVMHCPLIINSHVVMFHTER